MPRNNFILTLALFVSLAVHGAAIFYLGDRPLGKVDMELAGRAREVLTVHRSQDDVIYNLRFDQPEAMAPHQARLRNMPDLSKMSAALLADQAAVPEPIEVEPGTFMQLHELDVQREINAEEQLEVAVDLPSVLGNELLGPTPAPLTFVPGDVEPDFDVDDPGAGGGDSARARAMLARAGLKRGYNPLPTPKPHVVELEPVDQPIVTAPLAQPEIDFAEIALEHTTKLDIPEHLDSDFEYKLTVWTDRNTRRAPYNYFRIDIQAKPTLRKLHTLPKDVVFLIDVSGSVEQNWVDQSILGVWDSLATLNPNDRFNIVLFNDKAAALSNEGALPPTDENIQKVETFLSDTKAQGYTDVNRAIRKLLVRDIDRKRVYDIILISDGVPTRGVLDTRKLIDLITKENDLAASIYCVGIGAKQDRTLLNFLAYRNRGFSTFIEKDTIARDRIRELMSRLRYPIMKEVTLSTVGLENQEIYPVNLPTIHQGERFSIFGIYNRPDRFTMRVNGHNGVKKLDFTNAFDLENADRGPMQISVDWANWKLHHLYNRVYAEGERQSLLSQIDELRGRYKLKTLY